MINIEDFQMVKSSLSSNQRLAYALDSNVEKKQNNIRILYCSSWGYQKYFLEVRRYIESNYPSYKGSIDGANYPPTHFAKTCAQITNFIWLFGIALLMAGKQFLTALGIEEPPVIYKKIFEENKAIAFFALFMINNIGNSMLSTGTLSPIVF